MPRDEVEDLLRRDGDFVVRKTEVILSRLSLFFCASIAFHAHSGSIMVSSFPLNILWLLKQILVDDAVKARSCNFFRKHLQLYCDMNEKEVKT